MYSVGYIEGQEFDFEREHWRETGPRPLLWAAWYPCDPNAKLTTHAMGDSGTALFRMDPVSKGARLNSEKAQYPVVLLSHGTGGSAQAMCWLGTRLAEQGFICLAVSHHGNCIAEPYMAEGFICWWERARDLSVILDKLASQGRFVDRLDLSAVSAAGFSLGGYTVLSLLGAVTHYDRFLEWLAGKGLQDTGPKEFPNLSLTVPELTASSEKFRNSMERQDLSYTDDRIKSAVVFAPAPPIRALDPNSLRSISVPVGILAGQDDREAPHQDCAVWLKDQCSAMSLDLLGENIGHYVFLPEATDFGRKCEPEICGDPVGVSRRGIHDHAAMIALEKFAQ